MNFSNYYKHKDIIIIPKNNEKHNLKNINKIDVKPNKNNSYENIREIVLENKNENIKKDLDKHVDKTKINIFKHNIV